MNEWPHTSSYSVSGSDEYFVPMDPMDLLQCDSCQ